MEKALICAVFSPALADPRITVILDEMESLAETAGALSMGRIWQKRTVPDRRFLIGSGKIEEMREHVQRDQIQTVLFYNLLNPVQQRNIEETLQVKVIDRTRLILDIFALNARSMEGKLQVELAQYLYLLPRLTGKGRLMSRLGGGIGTRGPGETKLETDRRVIAKRIALVRKRLKHVMRSREIQRKRRADTVLPVISLVGYTSAGKSTLFHCLSGEQVHISRQLFSTLDPLLRRIPISKFGPGFSYILSDTVGFIHDMPDELYTAFQATLEEILQADLILHVIDLSNPDFARQKSDVEEVLAKMDIPSNKIVSIFNKSDLLDNVSLFQKRNSIRNGKEIFVSAKTGAGTEEIHEIIFQKYFSRFRRYSFKLSHGEFHPDALSRWAIILNKTYHDGEISVEILCMPEKWREYSRKKVSGN